MLLLLLIQLQCVFSASVQPSAIQMFLPCSNLMLAGNHPFWFSYVFPKRLRHLFLFAFSQLSYVFSSHLFKICHQNSQMCNTATIWAVIPGAAMETQELLEKFSGNSCLLTCSLGHSTWSCYHNALSSISLGQKVNCNSLFLSTDHRSILNKFPFFF